MACSYSLLLSGTALPHRSSYRELSGRTSPPFLTPSRSMPKSIPRVAPLPNLPLGELIDAAMERERERERDEELGVATRSQSQPAPGTSATSVSPTSRAVLMKARSNAVLQARHPCNLFRLRRFLPFHLALAHHSLWWRSLRSRLGFRRGRTSHR